MEKLIEKLKLELEELANTEPVDLDEINIRLNIITNYGISKFTKSYTEFVHTMESQINNVDTSKIDTDSIMNILGDLKNYGK